MNGKNYTVMELAEQIGVPRTTINDWLARYSQYIDSTLQGKRKVYPESALAVLREIAALRNSGKSFPEIETELSAKHPIRAVPVPPQEEKTEAKPSAAPDPASEAKPGTGENSSGFAVIARQQSEEIGRLIGESFRNMEQRIQGLEKLSAAQRRLSYLWLTACICFAVLLAATGYWAWIRMRVAGEENRQLRDQQAATSARLQFEGEENRRLRDQQAASTAELTRLQQQSVTLDARNRNFQANIAKLQSELQQQKKDFDQNIRAEKERLTELHRAQEKTLAAERDQARLQVREQETRLALEKEKFAAERLKLLKELEALKQQQESLKAELKAEQAKKQTPPPAKPVQTETPAASAEKTPQPK